MRAGKSVTVSSAEARRLKALVKDRNAPQKHVWRAKIVLLTADGVGTNEIMRQSTSRDIRNVCQLAWARRRHMGLRWRHCAGTKCQILTTSSRNKRGGTEIPRIR